MKGCDVFGKYDCIRDLRATVGRSHSKTSANLAPGVHMLTATPMMSVATSNFVDSCQH